jgi:hypothetical protein
VTTPTLSLNDEVLHLTATQDAVTAMSQGLDPTDFWLAQIGMGYPLFHHYQHIPHLFLAITNLVTSSFLSLMDLFNISRFILLVFFPLSVFVAMRRFGFEYLAAGLSALFASLISTNGLYGLDFSSYIWRGYGLYTQLWAMFFLPLAMAEVYRASREESSFFWPVFLSALVLLSNLLYGYILFISAIFFIFLKAKRNEIFERAKRLILIGILIGLVSAYEILPSVLDRNFFNPTVWFDPIRYDSYGFSWVLENLFKGNLLDYGRFPSFTILFFAGIVVLALVKRYREEKYRILLIIPVVWLLFYFGRSTWGPLFNILPFASDLQANRFIAGFHLGAIMLAGAGLSQVWQLIGRRFIYLGIISLLILIGFLSPVYMERGRYCMENGNYRAENRQALEAEKQELAEIVNTLKDLPPGKVYAGLPANFGKSDKYRIGMIPLYAIFPQNGLDSFGYAYHAFALSDDIRLLFNDARPAEYNLFNIRYVLLHKTWTPGSFYIKVKEFQNYTLYQVPGTGYFDFVDPDALFYGSRKDFYQANSRWFESTPPATRQNPIVFVGAKPQDSSGLEAYSFKEVNNIILAELAQRNKPGEMGKIFNDKAEFNKYSVQFEAYRESYLMLKQNYHPGWKTYIDGKEAATVMLAPGFAGTKVQPGTHEAVFLYQSPPWRLPLIILGILILVILAVISIKPDILKKVRKWE